MVSGCWPCFVHAQSNRLAQITQCFSQNFRAVEDVAGEAKGQLDSHEAELCVLRWLGGQEVGLRAWLDGEQLVVRGHAQCVGCLQVCQDPSSRTRFPEIPSKPQNPSN